MRKNRKTPSNCNIAIVAVADVAICREKQFALDMSTQSRKEHRAALSYQLGDQIQKEEKYFHRHSLAEDGPEASKVTAVGHFARIGYRHGCCGTD